MDPLKRKNMMLNRFFRGTALLVLLALACGARAQSTIKVGVIAEFSGPFAAYGQQIEAGMKAYMKQTWTKQFTPRSIR